MEDQEANCPSPRPRPGVGSSDTPAVRSRWTPKPEQILILESIFNSGMVNPPKDETIRIRKLLEKFGSVGDANVFYWFQNRRSRSRRRQRQIQAGLLQTPNNSTCIATGAGADHTADISIDHHHQAYSPAAAVFHHHHYDQPTSSNTISVAGLAPSQHLYSSSSSSPSTSTSAGHDGGVNTDALFSISQQMSLPDMDQNSILCPSSDMISSNLQYQSGSIVTVFINGIATEVPRGPFDLSTMFGQDHVMLVHSSTGVPVPVNEYGIIVQSLQMGESYFLVSGLPR